MRNLLVVPALPFAVVITGFLFTLMHLLLDRTEIDLEEKRAPVKIVIDSQIEETDVTRKKVFKAPKIDQPPPPPPATSRLNVKPTVDAVAPPPDFGTSTKIETQFNPDRDAQPLVRIPPQYPDRCFNRHKETEYIRLEFDVTPEGRVVDVRVLSSTNSCFDRSAKRAAGRWKYQPKVVDQKPAPRFGVQTTIIFEPAPAE